MWSLIEFQCGAVLGQGQPHISYHILSLGDIDIAIRNKSAGNMKMRTANWLEEVRDVNLDASVSKMWTPNHCPYSLLYSNLIALLTLKYCPVWITHWFFQNKVRPCSLVPTAGKD